MSKQEETNLPELDIKDEERSKIRYMRPLAPRNTILALERLACRERQLLKSLSDLKRVEAERDALDKLINTPSTADFLRSVELEAAHQVGRWSSEHDAGKSDADWFWLIGYLAGKVLSAPTMEKKFHHIISTAAVCLNWHRHVTGEITEMRTGIEPPKEPEAKLKAETETA